MLIVELEAPNGSGRQPPGFQGSRIAPATQAGSSLYQADILYAVVLFLLGEEKSEMCTLSCCLHNMNAMAVPLERALHDVILRLRNTKPSSGLLRTRRRYRPKPQLL